MYVFVYIRVTCIFLFLYMHVTCARMLERTGRSSWMISSAPAHVVINAIANISMLRRWSCSEIREQQHAMRPTYGLGFRFKGLGVQSSNLTCGPHMG